MTWVRIKGGFLDPRSCFGRAFGSGDAGRRSGRKLRRSATEDDISEIRGEDRKGTALTCQATGRTFRLSSAKSTRRALPRDREGSNERMYASTELAGTAILLPTRQICLESVAPTIAEVHDLSGTGDSEGAGTMTDAGQSSRSSWEGDQVHQLHAVVERGIHPSSMSAELKPAWASITSRRWGNACDVSWKSQAEGSNLGSWREPRGDIWSIPNSLRPITR